MKIRFNKNWHFILVGVAFLMCLISMYFGASIYSAKDAQGISHLNEIENIRNYKIESIPKLSKVAALITLPMLVTLLIFTALIIRTSSGLIRKRVAKGLVVAQLIILTVIICTIVNPVKFDFSAWGLVWITMGIFIVAGNIFSYFLEENTEK